MLRKGILDSVSTERHLPDWHFRPDIVCFSAGKPKALIDVVDTHSPESQVIDAGLPVPEIHVVELDDLQSLNEGAVTGAKLHNFPCPDPVHATCRRRKSEGCLNCQRCDQHVGPSRAYCQERQACRDDDTVTCIARRAARWWKRFKQAAWITDIGGGATRTCIARDAESS